MTDRLNVYFMARRLYFRPSYLSIMPCQKAYCMTTFALWLAGVTSQWTSLLSNRAASSSTYCRSGLTVEMNEPNIRMPFQAVPCFCRDKWRPVLAKKASLANLLGDLSLCLCSTEKICSILIRHFASPKISNDF